MAVARRKPSRTRVTVLLVVLAVIVVLVVLATKSSPSASYSAIVSDAVPQNPQELSVTFHVTNTGKATGTPQCTLNAHSPGYADTGVDVVTLKDSVPPGTTTTAVDTFTITNNGAQNVLPSGVSVSCS